MYKGESFGVEPDLIQIALYVAAGFLAATLIALLTLPFLTGRAASNAVRKLRAKLPFSTAEMTAEKDQLRAEFAVTLRKVEIELAKQSERVANQNIEIRKLDEKLAGASKVGKASKLALEEIRSKEHDLNDRLRQRDAQYAGLEQRARQMLRENRELKLELKKDGKDVKAILAGLNGDASAAKANQSKSGLPIADIALAKDDRDLSAKQLRSALDEALRKNAQAEKQIKLLQQSVSGEAAETASAKMTLPEAPVPEKLGGPKNQSSKMEVAGETEAQSALRNQILNVAANLTAMTAMLEEDNSTVRKILDGVDAKSDGALGERMKAILKAVDAKPTEMKAVKPAAQSQPKKAPARKTTPVKTAPAKTASSKTTTAKASVDTSDAKAATKLPEAKGLQLAKDVRPQTDAKNTSPAKTTNKKPGTSSSTRTRSATRTRTPAKQNADTRTTSAKTEKA